MDDVIIAIIIVDMLNILLDSISRKPIILAPMIIGIDRRKENLAAWLGGIPKNIPIDIVEPDLEIPGIIAKACAIPTRIDEDKENPFCRFLKFLGESSINPFMNNAIPTKFTLLNICKK